MKNFIKGIKVGSKNVFASKKTMRSKFDLKKTVTGGVKIIGIFFDLVAREWRDEAMATLAEVDITVVEVLFILVETGCTGSGFMKKAATR